MTSERYDRLTSLGFVWNVGPPIVPWETRFAELMEYYEEHGRWPSQSVPGLGEWVHKQRGMYARNEEGYMKHKAPRVSAIEERVLRSMCSVCDDGNDPTCFLLLRPK